MIIYRIYKIIISSEYDTFTEEFIDKEKDITIKYVSNKEKVEEFFNEVKSKNKNVDQCYNCPIINLTKRMYDNGKHDNLKAYCDNKDLVFSGNTISCKNEKLADFTAYYYEEIQVE